MGCIIVVRKRHGDAMNPSPTYKTVVVALFAAAAAFFQMMHGVIGIPTGFGMTVDLAGLPVLLAFFLFGFEEALGVCVLLAIIITFVSPETWLGASMKFAATVPMIIVPALWVLVAKAKSGFGRAVSLVVLVAAFTTVIFILASYANLSVPDIGGGVLYRSFQSPDSKGVEVTPGVLLKGFVPIAVIAIMSLFIAYLWGRYGKGAKISSLSDPKTIIMVSVIAIIVRGVAMIIANYYFAGPLFFGMAPGKMMELAPWYVLFGWNAFQGAIELFFAWAIAFKFRFAEYYGSS